MAIHEFLGLDVIARAAAFNHVAGEGEGRAAESDDAERVLEMGDDALDGVGNVGQLGGAVGDERIDGFGIAERLVDDGAFALLEFKVEAHAIEREEQVGKDDGGVDAELFRGGDSDFGGKLGAPADFEERMMAADFHVFGHIAAGLAEEPDGGTVDGLAQAGADETRGRGGRGDIGSCGKHGATFEGSRKEWRAGRWGAGRTGGNSTVPG